MQQNTWYTVGTQVDRGCLVCGFETWTNTLAVTDPFEDPRLFSLMTATVGNLLIPCWELGTLLLWFFLGKNSNRSWLMVGARVMVILGLALLPPLWWFCFTWKWGLLTLVILPFIICFHTCLSLLAWPKSFFLWTGGVRTRLAANEAVLLDNFDEIVEELRRHSLEQLPLKALSSSSWHRWPKSRAEDWNEQV